MTRIKDIAEKAGVSTATVSYVLNKTGNVGVETQQRVMEVVKELNYQPNRIAKSLKLKKTHTIGVMVEDITVFNAPTIIDGINKYAEENGWSIILSNMRIHQLESEQDSAYENSKDVAPKVAEDLISKQVDGIIYIGVHPRNIEGVLADIGKPIVYTYCFTSDPKGYCINYNDEEAAYTATKYLIDKGHRKIATISGLINSGPSKGRLNGYCKALGESEIPYDEKFVQTGDWEYQSGYDQGMKLLENNQRPTAILGMNDLMAAGVIKAAKDIGLSVPKDVSVMGIDDRELSFYLDPKLTTMKLPLLEMGRESIEILTRLINKEVVPFPPPFNCSLLERESVKELSSLA